MYKWSYKKFICNIFTTATAAGLIWLIISYLEIICKNLTAAPEYSNNNLLIILFKNLDAFLQGGIF